MIVNLAYRNVTSQSTHGLSSCEHRTVSKDGRIICSKIVDGENEVTPNLCRACPFKAVNCRHLRFSLRQITPSPLIVRYNGHTEIWNDDPPELRFERAACAARVIPVESPRACLGCSMRCPINAPAERPKRRERQPAQDGNVVPFPLPDVAAATA